MKFRFFIILLFLASLVSAAIFSVGVSPDTVLVGDISPGETKIVKFGIFSASDEALLVYLSSENGNFDFFNKGYKEYMSNFSEEPAAGWIEFVNNPVEIDPTIRKMGRGWTDINLLLHVPEGAEPGYHVIQISPMPAVFGQIDAPAGTSIVSITKVSIIFNVAGDAKREGLILDTTADGYTGRSFNAKTFFQNTGTVTLNAVAINRIYDLNDTFLGEFESSHEYVKPKSTVAFYTPIHGTFPEGAYKVDSRVLFTTGAVGKTSIVNLYAPITGAAVAQPQQFPWLWVLLIVVVIIIVVWRFYGKR